MSHLWSLIAAHLDETGARQAELARRIGTQPQTVNSWKKRGLRKLPDQELLQALAVEIRQPYGDVLRAVLQDIGYLDEHVDSLSEEQVRAAYAPGLSADQRRRIIKIIQENRPGSLTKRGPRRLAEGE